MDYVFITDLRARGVIGVDHPERDHPQEIVINLALFTDAQRAGQTDRLEDCVNYAAISKMVLEHAESSARHTVEALASDLAALCLQVPGVQRVRVRVEKPGAVRFTRSTGVEIERTR